MKAAGVFILIFVVALSTAKADGTCEKIENYGWSIGNLKTCVMYSTAIDSKNFSITSGRDATVDGFWADRNKQLKHLPNNLGTKFPNLLGLNAAACSIKEVSKDTFKGLVKLRYLYLYYNQIEKIDDDTFEFIPAVEKIWLEGNKIKKLNGRAFASLHKLTRVYLDGNECINESFYTTTRIAELQRVVTGKCGFTESETSTTKNVKSEADLMAQSELQALKLENARLQAGNAELQALKLETARLQAGNAELQALKLENARLIIEKAKADLQTAHHNELQAQHNEIKAQLKETCDARIELKVQEISNLSNDLQAKTAEINEKNEKIKQFEKKIQILGGDGP